jgi:large subunit ribosomal protein L25
MAETPVLEAAARDGVGKGAARRIRRDGYVPGVIYGGGKDPQSITIRHNVLLKHLKAGKFLSTLLNVKVDGADNRVICRGVQRDVVKDLPTHVDFLRLSERSRIALSIPVEFINRDKSPGIKRGGVLTIVRNEVELVVTAGDIPEQIVVDLEGSEINDTLHISQVKLPAGSRPTITDRDFVIANIQAPSGLRSADDADEAEEADAEEAAED